MYRRFRLPICSLSYFFFSNTTRFLVRFLTSVTNNSLGGSLKIFGYEIEPSRPYVTLLVALTDRVSAILEETLQKYGISENVHDYLLIEV